MQRPNLQIDPSPILNYFLLTTTIAACIIVLFLSLFVVIKLVLISMIIASYCYYQFFTMKISHVLLDDDNEWRIFLEKGEMVVGQLLGDTYVSRLVIILVFKLNRRWPKVCLVIPRGMLSFEQFRDLGAYLRAWTRHIKIK